MLHGLRSHRLYGVWINMRRRCYDTTNPYYGGRGIAVCPEWSQDVKRFIEWALAHEWEEGLQIDREDTNGDYCPENCRWVTPEVNGRNKRNNVRLTFQGETRLVKDWAEITGIAYSTILRRVQKYNWCAAKALTTPSKRSNK